MIRWLQKFNRSSAENARGFAQMNDALHPREERMLRSPLRFHINPLISVNRVGNQWRVQTFRIGAGKSAVPPAIPLHRRAYTIAVAEINVVAHADFIAIINDRSSGHGHQ